MQNLINSIKEQDLDKSNPVIHFYFVTSFEKIKEYIKNDINSRLTEFMDLISKEGVHRRKSMFDLFKGEEINKPLFNYKKLFLGKDLSHFKENFEIKIDESNGTFSVGSNFEDEKLNDEFKYIYQCFRRQFKGHYNYLEKSLLESYDTGFKYYYSLATIQRKNHNVNSLKNSINRLFSLYPEYSSSLYSSDFPSNEIAYKINNEYFNFKRGEFFKSNAKYRQTDTLRLINDQDLSLVEAMYLIGKRHGDQRVVIKFKPIVDKIDFDDTNTIELNKEFEDTLLNKYGQEEILTTIEFNNIVLESKFNDFQAFHICKGLKNQQHLYDLYRNGRSTLEHRFKAHQLANSTLQKYGKAKVDFILSLPTLPFKTDRFKVLFSKLDKMKQNIESPVLRFKIKDIENKDQTIEVEFLVQEGNVYKNQLRIRNTTTNQPMFDVSRSGKAKLNDNLNGNQKNRNITPVIQLFYQISEDENQLNKAILAYGIESGKCSICGRTLTDELSKLEGIGPVCKQYI